MLLTWTQILVPRNESYEINPAVRPAAHTLPPFYMTSFCDMSCLLCQPNQRAIQRRRGNLQYTHVTLS